MIIQLTGRRTTIHLLCFVLVFVLIISLFSCGLRNIFHEENEDVIAIGKYIAMYKNGIQFTLTGLEKAEYDDNVVLFNVSGKADYPDEEIVDVALIIVYNRNYQDISLRFWRDFEFGIGLETKRRWEECEQRQDGIKHYSEEEVAEIREKAEEYAQYIKSLDD